MVEEAGAIVALMDMGVEEEATITPHQETEIDTIIHHIERIEDTMTNAVDDDQDLLPKTTTNLGITDTIDQITIATHLEDTDISRIYLK